MQHGLRKFDVVLLGIGHTNAQVLDKWRMNPLPDTQLTCVTDFPVAAYSGMMPGTLSGQYLPAEMEIDLVRLCAAAGARLIQEQVTGLDVKSQRLQFAERPAIPFDALSIGVGSRPVSSSSIGSALGNEEMFVDESDVLQIKPMQTFVQRLDLRLQSLARTRPDSVWRIAIIGGGAGGFEVACCLPGYIARYAPSAKVDLTLVDRGSEILKSMPSRTRALARRALDEKGIRQLVDREIAKINGEGRLLFTDGSSLETDLVLWTTSARAPAVLQSFELPKDERGFLLTRNTLQSTSADSIFAVGDAGTLSQQPLAKAGVYAVRQGPTLWENLKRHLAGRPTIEWRPQTSFMTLLNTGDDRAILTYKGVSMHAGWCWKMKDAIDRRFMAKYQDYTPAMQRPETSSISQQQMHCGGCGSKIPADTLTRVLSGLDNPSSSGVLVGLENAGDVAVLQNTTSLNTAVTVDFFTAFLDEPFLVGQVAAQNALSDLYASGADPRAALAMVTVPHGPTKQQEQFLRNVLDGGLQILRPAGVSVVGGHTIEGEQATIGFTLFGDIDPREMTSKAGLQTGDRLVLTKSLGTGILLAGQQLALCRADWMAPLVSSMLASNLDASLVARELGIRAMTDITGFGFAGHLLEMLSASSVSAELSLSSIPLLPGALELADQGIESTLAPGNRQVECSIVSAEGVNRRGRYAALFDPQTSGGLLLGVPERLLASLQERLADSAVVIGKVIPATGDDATIHVSR